MKKILLGVAGLLALAVIGLGVFLAGFDLNQYKDDIVQLATDATGRTVEIKGDLGFKPSLIPTLSIAGVTLGNAEWAQHGNMFEVDQFEARVQLLPLLSGAIKINHVLIDGATLILEQNSDGRGNWAFDGVPQEAADESATSGSPPQFDVRSIVVRNSRIEYRAARADAVIVGVPDMRLAPQGFGKPLSLEADIVYNDMPIGIAAELAPIGRLFDNEPYNLALEVQVMGAAIELKGVVEKPLDGTGLALDTAISLNDAGDLPADLQPTVSPWLPVDLRGKLLGGGDEYVLSDVALKAAQSDINANVVADIGGDKPALKIKLSGKQIVLPAQETASEESPPAERMFSTDPLALDGLQAANVDLNLDIGRIVAGDTVIEAVSMVLELDDGELELKMPKAQLGGGTMALETELDASGKVPELSLRLKLAGISVPQLMSAKERENLSGGTLVANIEFDGEGVSMAKIADSANGAIKLRLSGLEIKDSTIATGDLALRAFDALNPLSGKTDSETLECAVVNFPISDGIAESETGLAIQTSRLNILGGGSIDLGTEKIDIGVNPKPREGIGLNVAGIADFVRLGGTIMDPKPTTDAAGIAKAGLKAGAAIATMGLSVVAEGALDRTDGDLDVCGIADGSVEPPKSKTAQTGSKVKEVTESATNAVKDAGGAIGKKLKGLFGN